MVTCCEAYEDIEKGDVGRVIKVDNDGLHDLNILAHWRRKAGTYWLRFVHVELTSEYSPTGTPIVLHLHTQNLCMVEIQLLIALFC